MVGLPTPDSSYSHCLPKQATLRLTCSVAINAFVISHGGGNRVGFSPTSLEPPSFESQVNYIKNC